MHLNPKRSKGLIGAVSKDGNCVPHGTYDVPLKSDTFPSVSSDTALRYFYFLTISNSSVKFFIQKSPNVHKSMLLRGAILNPRTLNEMDLEVMRRHATTHDRIQNLSGERDRNSNGGQRYQSRNNNNYAPTYDTSQSGSQHMKWYPPAQSTPGIPPSNAQASQWYQQQPSTTAYNTAPNGAHNSGIMRLDDLRTQFGGNSNSRGGFQGGSSQGGGYYSQGQRNVGNGYYQNQGNRYNGYGYGDRR